MKIVHNFQFDKHYFVHRKIHCTCYIIISSTRVRHRVAPMDEAPILKFSEQHACRTITGADDIKLNERDQFGEWWNEICDRRNPEINLPRPHFVHHENPQGLELGTPAAGCKHLTAYAMGPPSNCCSVAYLGIGTHFCNHVFFIICHIYTQVKKYFTFPHCRFNL